MSGDRYALPPSSASTELAGPLAASQRSAAAPPEWRDGASVYLTGRDRPTEPDASNNARADERRDPQVAPVAYEREEHVPSNSSAQDPRHLAPPADAQRRDQHGSSADSSGLMPSWGLSLDALYTSITGLVLVVGLFLLCMWALRRGTKRINGLLPKEAVSVVGRTPLGARHFAQLLRVGNKLVLISVTPSGAEPLTEVTDPVEVERLLGLCLEGAPPATATDYEQVFRRLSQAPAAKDLLSKAGPTSTTYPATDVYRGYQGGGKHG